MLNRLEEMYYSTTSSTKSNSYPEIFYKNDLCIARIFYMLRLPSNMADVGVFKYTSYLGQEGDA